MAGTSFEIDLGVAGAAGADSAATSLDRLAANLEAAKNAASAAADAVSAGEAKYRQAEAAANSAAKALERISAAADAQRGKLAEALQTGDGAGIERASAKLALLNTRQAEASAKAASTKAAVEAEAASLDHLKTAAEKASANEDKLSKAHAEAQKASAALAKAQQAGGASGKVNELAEAFGRLGGPLGAVGQKAFGAADGLRKLVGAAGTAVGATAAVVLAVVAVVAALGAGVFALTKWSLGLSEANRSALLLSQGIAQSVEGGKSLDRWINAVADTVPQSADELRNMAAELAKTGLKGRDLEVALQSAAEKAAKAKFGPEWEQQLLSVDKQSEIFRRHISNLFGGLKIEGLLGSLARIVGLFDETSASGHAIKVVFESLFQPIVDGLTALGPKIVSTFIQFEIWVLKALIAIKPFGSKIAFVAELIGVAALAIGAAIGIVLAMLVAGSAAFAAFLGGLIWLGSKFLEVTGIADGFGAVVGAAFDAVVGAGTAFYNWISNLSLDQLGSQLIDGFVSGIISSGAKVVGAVTGVVTGAIDGAKKLLGIASPSKVFAEIGMQTAAGMAGGVEGGTGQVSSALESMVSPPDASAPSGVATTNTSVGGNTISITVNANGGDGNSIAAAVKDALLSILEGDAMQLAPEVSGA